MTLSRRQFLASTAAVLAAGPTLATTPMAGDLIAAEASIQIAPPDYPPTRVWAFNTASPGPEIRLAQGERLTRTLKNSLPQATSIHWHGLRLPNAMDGVPGLTQTAVAPGDSFVYDFTPPDAGTFWYHSHQNAVEQLERGLYGPLIVTEADAPDVDGDEVIVLDDWRLTDKAEVDPAFDNSHDFSHAGRIGNFVTSNSRYDLTLTVRRHDRLRLRLINAANAQVFDLGLAGMSGWIVAHDGMPLETPEAVDRLTLGPGQRADLIADVSAESGGRGHLVRIERGQGYALVAFDVRGQNASARRGPPLPLPPNPVQGPDGLTAARTVPLLMAGGAMGGMRSAVLEGVETGMRDLAQIGMYWAFNGNVGLPESPLITAAIGETIRMPIDNQTVFPHAMHLHGQHFREVQQDGSFGPLRDTLLVQPREKREIAFVADNPGDWLFHCHMLAHQVAGMKTWIKVT